MIVETTDGIGLSLQNPGSCLKYENGTRASVHSHPHGARRALEVLVGDEGAGGIVQQQGQRPRRIPKPFDW